MTRKILGLLAAAALVAGCEFAKKTDWEGPGPQCRAVGDACTDDVECCSYGCGALNVCVQNTVPGGVCKTTTDCGSDLLTGPMLCKSGNCSTTATCRDDGDVCGFPGDCCSNHCAVGACVPNNPPVVSIGASRTIPRNTPVALTNDSTDPDPGETTTLAFGWHVTPPAGLPATWTLSDSGARNPTFNPGSSTGAYVISLDVTDDWGLVRTATITLTVVNTPPTIAGLVDVSPWSRSQPLTLTPAANDADGDAVTCWWTLRDPLGASTTPVAAAPCNGSFPLTFTPGPALAAEGIWTATLHATSVGNAEVTRDALVTVVNDPPVVTIPALAVVPAGARTFNLGAEARVTATFTDVNGDDIATWSWTSADAGALLDANTATVRFTPGAVGEYTLTVEGCDRVGSCDTATVLATVYPYVRPLGNVVDAAWRKSDDRLIVIGTDAAAANRLWVVDPTSDPSVTPDPYAPLGAIPVALSVKGDGTEAIVGETASHWQTVSLVGTPAESTLWTGPFTPTAVVHHGNRGFTINGTLSPSVYQLNLSGSYAAVGCTISGGGACTPTGDRMVSDGGDLWILDASTNLSRYSVNNGNGDLTRLASVAVSSTATGLWRSSDPTYLFLPGANGVKNSATLANVGTLPAGATHADSSLTLASIVGLAATGATVTTFGASFELGPQAPITLPHWGTGGDDRTLTAKYVFVSSDGNTAHVIVQSSAPSAWGLYSFPLP